MISLLNVRMYGVSACGCKIGANYWIEAWFGDCVYSAWEMTAFLIGLSSMMFWIVAQVPQLINNWRLQSSEALSPWFLFQWLAGDSFNLLGCLLTGDQLATETLTATYFMFADCFMIFQYIYYQPAKQGNDELLCKGVEDVVLKKGTPILVYSPPSLPPTQTGLVVSKGVESSTNPVTHSTGEVKTSGKFLYGDRSPLILNQVDVTEFQGNQPPRALVPDTPSTRRQLRRVIMQYGLEYGPPCGPRLTIHHGPLRKCSNKKSLRLVSAALIGVAGLICVGTTIRNQGWSYQPEISSVGLAVGRKLMTICGDTNRIWWVKDSGTTFGWASASLYISSRFSQIIKNNERGSAEGLSLAMVTFAALANLTYGVAIIMRLVSWQDFVGKAPWLMGSLGTVSLDLTLLLQAHYLCYYSRLRIGKLNEYTPLLVLEAFLSLDVSTKINVASKISTNKVRGTVLKLGTRVEVRDTEVSDWTCWHNAIVLTIRYRNRLIHIKYEEKLDEGENVEEHVVYDRVRLIAPEFGLESCVPGTLVEARNCGWWTGKIKKVIKCRDKYLVYFSHFGCANEFEKNKIRLQQDWFVAPHKKKYAWHIKEEMVANLSYTVLKPLVETSTELLGEKDVTMSSSESKSESSSHQVQESNDSDANPTLAMLLKEVQAEKHATPPQHRKSLLR